MAVPNNCFNLNFKFYIGNMMKNTIRVSVVAGLVMAAISGSAHAVDASNFYQAVHDANADSELYAIKAGMSEQEVAEKINAALSRGNISDSYKARYIAAGWEWVSQNTKWVKPLVETKTITPPATVSNAPFPDKPQTTATVFAPSVVEANPVATAPAYIAPVATKTPVAPVISKAAPAYDLQTIKAPVASATPIAPTVAAPFAKSVVSDTTSATLAAQNRLNALKAADAAIKAGNPSHGAMDVQAHNDAVDYQQFNNKFASVAAVEHKRHVMQDQQVVDAANIANDRAHSLANIQGGKITTKANQTVDNNPRSINPAAVAQYVAPVQSMAHESRPNTGASVPATVYNSQSQKVNDHSQAVANIKGGKVTAIIAPPAYSAPAPTPVAVATPKAPVINAPVKQTQGGGVWAKAPDIKGTFDGNSVTVITNQNHVAAQRPSTPIVVNPDVIGQPVSTTVVEKQKDISPAPFMDSGKMVAGAVSTSKPADPKANKATGYKAAHVTQIVTHTDYSNKTPAAKDGVSDTPVHTSNTVVNHIAPATTVDKWGTDHTVTTIGGNNVKNNVTNAKDNATNKASLPAGVSQIIPATALTPSKPAAQPTQTTNPAPVAKPAAQQPAKQPVAVAVTPKGNPVTVNGTPVQAPVVAPASSQPVNSYYVSQVSQAQVDANSNDISSLKSHEKQQDKQIAANNKKAMAGIAGAMAQTGLHYTDSANSVAAGVGNYDGESAVSVGYSHQWGNNVRFSVQNSVDTAHNVGTSASIAIGW